jgi:septum formation topological specificity factor MinE
LCRLEARQSNTTKITEESQKILLIIQGNSRTEIDYILSAKEELIDNIKKYFNITVDNEFYCIGRELND